MIAQKDYSQTQVRLPNEIYEELKASSERNLRSMNSEILYWLLIGMGKSAAPVSAEEVREILTDVVRSELKRNREG